MCGWGPYAREASVWEACCRYSGVINMFLNCPQKTDSWTVSAWASRANWPTFVVFHEQTHGSYKNIFSHDPRLLFAARHLRLKTARKTARKSDYPPTSGFSSS